MTQTSVAEIPAFLQDLDASYFQVACRQAAEIMRRPEYNGRLDKAAELVLNGAVTLHDDGTATVRSGSHTYHLEPECTCEDSQRRSLHCKHRLAVILLKRTLERLHQPAVNGNGHHADTSIPAPEPQPIPQPDYPESTCCIKDVIAGREVSWTLRGDDRDVSSRVQRIFKFLDNLKDVTPAPDPQSQGEHWCSEHQTYFKRQSNASGVWYSHQKADGKWCKEK